MDELVEASRPRLAEMLRAGTTTAEVKSGYGLTTESELAMLRAIARLAAEQPIELAATFMGAHEVPPEFRDNRDGYVRLLMDEMIPAVTAERLAEWNDVFCEHGVFTPAEAQQILDAGRRAGLMPRIHANELGETGGAQVAALVGARSADHLVFLSDADIGALAQAGVVATLLPAASFYLKLGRFAPARRLIDGGVPVALATDVNPGGGFSPSMPFTMTLACFAMGLTFEEALNAATINGAYALDRHDRVGSLEPGKQCDVVVVNGAPVELLRVGRFGDPDRDQARTGRMNPGQTRPGAGAVAPIGVEPVGMTGGAQPADEDPIARYTGPLELIGVGAPDIEKQPAVASNEPSRRDRHGPSPWRRTRSRAPHLLRSSKGRCRAR